MSINSFHVEGNGSRHLMANILKPSNKPLVMLIFRYFSKCFTDMKTRAQRSQSRVVEVHGRGLHWDPTSPEGPNQNLAGGFD